MGLATARALVKEGWTLAIADLNVASGEEAATELKGRFYRTNVGDYDDLANTFVKVWEDHGRLDFGSCISHPHCFMLGLVLPRFFMLGLIVILNTGI